MNPSFNSPATASPYPTSMGTGGPPPPPPTTPLAPSHPGHQQRIVPPPPISTYPPNVPSLPSMAAQQHQQHSPQHYADHGAPQQHHQHQHQPQYTTIRPPHVPGMPVPQGLDQSHQHHAQQQQQQQQQQHPAQHAPQQQQHHHQQQQQQQVSPPTPQAHQHQIPPASGPADDHGIPVPVALPVNGGGVDDGKDYLEPISRVDEHKRRYRLEVFQQPKRARMCGFGDKDRRPITPPPCVRLFVTDLETGKEADCNEIEHTMYVLNVDLWNETATSEVNLVRHSGATPSISSTTPTSFAQVQSQMAHPPILPAQEQSPGGMPFPHPPNVNPFSVGSQFQQGGQYALSPSGYGPAGVPFHRDSQYMSPVTSSPSSIIYPSGIDLRIGLTQVQPTGMFTRNLIGSLAASANRLTDPDDKIGIWFILQDLSVRTEGNFRLRFSFVNVAHPARPSSGIGVNKERAPVLASCFSEVFTVFSAKKFPGVCESTTLSKCFAAQGIKIPIRKEGGKGRDDDDDDEY